MTNETLLPCPFCGGKAIEKATFKGEPVTWCSNAPCPVQRAPSFTPDQWNRRAAAGEMPGAVAELIKDSREWVWQCENMDGHPGACSDCNYARTRIAAVESLYARAGKEENK